VDVFCSIHSTMHCIVLFWKTHISLWRMRRGDTPFPARLPVRTGSKHGTSVCLLGPGSHCARRGEVKADFLLGLPGCRNTDPSCVLRVSFKTKVLLPVVATLAILVTTTMWVVNRRITAEFQTKRRVR